MKILKRLLFVLAMILIWPIYIVTEVITFIFNVIVFIVILGFFSFLFTGNWMEWYYSIEDFCTKNRKYIGQIWDDNDPFPMWGCELTGYLYNKLL